MLIFVSLSVFPEAVTGKEGKDEKDSDQYLESDDSQGSTIRRSRDSLNLKRTVGLFSGISLIVGTMIGQAKLGSAKKHTYKLPL